GDPDYTGVVTNQDCEGIKTYYDNQNPKLYHLNRIRSVGLTGLTVNLVQSDNNIGPNSSVNNSGSNSSTNNASPNTPPNVATNSNTNDSVSNPTTPKTANTYTQMQAQNAMQKKVNSIQQTTDASTRFNNAV